MFDIGLPSCVFYVPDEAPQQFKNVMIFVNLGYYEVDFGVRAKWHFFATSHGKGSCDGIGGALKRLAARASLQLAAYRQILTPCDLYGWASMPATLSSIIKRFSGVSDYNAAKELLKERFGNAKSISQIQKQRWFIPTSENMLTKLYSASTDFRVHDIIKKKK